MDLVYCFRAENERLALAIAELAPTFATVRFHRISGPEDLLRDGLQPAAFIASGAEYGPEMATALGRVGGSLRWIQSTAAGIDAFVRAGVPAGVTLTHGGHTWGAAVAEHAMALLLQLARQGPTLAVAQAQAAWARQAVAPRLRTIGGLAMVIVGYGNIGREVAQRACGFGIAVTGLNRSGRKTAGDPTPVKRIVDLADQVSDADIVVVCAPLTDETRHIISADVIAAMKPSAFLINVGRGALVDQAALVSALDGDSLGGAGLDVMTPEPLGAGDPLWRCRNVVVTPHVGGFGETSYRNLAALCARNLARYLAGEALENVVPAAVVRRQG